MNHHILTGKLDITSNLLVGSSHLFVDTDNNRVGLVTTDPQAGLHVNSNVYVNTDLRVGPAGANQVIINDSTNPGRIVAKSFVGDGSGLQNTPPGPQGDAATIDVGTVTTGVPGSSASVTNSGSTSAATLDFTIPRGDTGAQGSTGDAATISVGTVTTGVPGSSASVTNSGTTNAATLDFTIPRGDTGATIFTEDGDDIYRQTGNVGIGTNSPSAKLDVNGALHLRSDITRSGHSTGYFVGSYNNVGANSYKTNPIYTIGSNYKPSDDSLGNMYGIGYSHGNFTSILTGGWGLYVAADGDARIGLNATSGIIKNTSHIYCGGTVHLSGSGSQGIRSATGNYGTVQTTGGGNGGWEGYSIDGRYVFMSSDNNSCGIYNDVDNEWMIYCYRNNYVKLYYNGGERVITTDYGTSMQGGGLRVHVFEATIDYANSSHDWWTNGGQIQADAPNLNFSLYCAGSIRAPAYVAFSDVRIKKDFLEIDDTLALDKLRLLKPTTYRYKDKTRNTTDRIIGFIAQEVAEVLPNAVSRTHGILPNIQCEASVEILNDTEIKIILVEPLPIDHTVKQGNKLIIKTPKYAHMEFEVVSIENDTTVIIKDKDGYDKIKSETRVWVFGEEVNDFHHLDKNAIFTIATAALQEVDRQQQADKARIVELETQLQSEKSKIATMELLVASLVTRVGDLERSLI